MIWIWVSVPRKQAQMRGVRVSSPVLSPILIESRNEGPNTTTAGSSESRTSQLWDSNWTGPRSSSGCPLIVAPSEPSNSHQLTGSVQEVRSVVEGPARASLETRRLTAALHLSPGEGDYSVTWRPLEPLLGKTRQDSPTDSNTFKERRNVDLRSYGGIADRNNKVKDVHTRARSSMLSFCYGTSWYCIHH